MRSLEKKKVLFLGDKKGSFVLQEKLRFLLLKKGFLLIKGFCVTMRSAAHSRHCSAPMLHGDSVVVPLLFSG